MPTIDENYNAWSSYKWPEEGDEWSALWGGTEYLWYGTIFPRIQAFLPTGNILEIAPGYGRCTQFLLAFGRALTVVDLTEKCIEACKKRFEAYSHIKYFVNDGKSLDMIADNSLDFVLSWDSLVHADSDVLASYVKYLAAKLKPGGVGFIHHSNMGSFKDPKTGDLTVENPHWRATDMTAELFREYCREAGIKCISQEVVAWGGDVLNDCFSFFVRVDGKNEGETIIVEYADFMREASIMKRISELYHSGILSRREQGSQEGNRNNRLSRMISKLKEAGRRAKERL